MQIDVVLWPGSPFTAPVITAYRRWRGACLLCGVEVNPGELLTYLPPEPEQHHILKAKTVRVHVVHLTCAMKNRSEPDYYVGRSCTPEEYAWLKALAGPTSSG